MAVVPAPLVIVVASVAVGAAAVGECCRHAEDEHDSGKENAHSGAFR